MCSDRYKIIDVCVTAAVEWQIDFLLLLLLLLLLTMY